MMRQRIMSFIVSFALFAPPSVGLATNAPTADGESNPLAGSNEPSQPLINPDPSAQARVREAYSKVPLSFEVNQGQTNSLVKFLSRGNGYDLFLTPTEAVLRLRKADGGWRTEANPKSKIQNPKSTVVRMKLVGATTAPQVMGVDELPGKNHYFIGHDPIKWRTNVSTYAKVNYENVYPGVDLVYYGNQQQLEYDFIVAPGANPQSIKLAFAGADKLELDSEGNLILHTAGGKVMQRAPVTYQEINGTKQMVPSRYALLGTDHASRLTPDASRLTPHVTFQVGAYDLTKPLVIDPVLVYSTYLGGYEGETAYDIAVDAAGNAYVVGTTSSDNFPTTFGALETTPKNAFVTKINAAGSALVYSTYLGGGGSDHVYTGTGASYAIAVDAAGNAYITGETSSDSFPTTPNAFQSRLSGNADAFATKLNATGSALLYSTYLGGSPSDNGHGYDVGYDIAVDAFGSAYVTGMTYSLDFPTTAGAFQREFSDPFGTGSSNGFVAKFDTTAFGPASLVYSTYLGGNLHDEPRSIAVDTLTDPGGNRHRRQISAYVTGWTNSTDFPTLSAFQSVYPPGANQSVFVTKLHPTGSALVYSTYLGGYGNQEGRGIAVDAFGNAYVTGTTLTPGSFPTTRRAFRRVADSAEAFVTKFNASGSALIYSTLLGGDPSDGTTGTDWANAIAVGEEAAKVYVAYVTGFTDSANFPTTGAVQPTYGGGNDAFVTKLNADGSGLIYSTYFGGSGSEEGFGIAVGGAGSAYVAGVTSSTDLPIVGAIRSDSDGGDAFVTKIAP